MLIFFSYNINYYNNTFTEFERCNDNIYIYIN